MSWHLRFKIHSSILFIHRLAIHFVLSPNSRNALTHSSTGCRWHATSLHITVTQGPSNVTGAKWQPWFIRCCFPGKHIHSNPLKKLTHSQLRQLQINFNLEDEIWICVLYPSYKPGITYQCFHKWALQISTERCPLETFRTWYSCCQICVNPSPFFFFLLHQRTAKKKKIIKINIPKNECKLVPGYTLSFHALIATYIFFF